PGSWRSGRAWSARSWCSALHPPTGIGRALDLGEERPKLPGSQMVRRPERLEDALPAAREARVVRERAHEDAVALAARHRGQAAAVKTPVDPDVPELVQGLAVLLGMRGQIHAGLVVVAQMEELVKARLRETLPREL